MSEHRSGLQVQRQEIDATGLACPIPVILTARRVKEFLEDWAKTPLIEGPAELVVVVTASDPAARNDLPAWARMRGYTALSTQAVPPPSGVVSGTTYVITISVPLSTEPNP